MIQTKKTQQQQKPQPYEQVGKRYRSLGKQFLEINNILEQNNDYTSTLVIKHQKRSTFRTYRRCYIQTSAKDQDSLLQSAKNETCGFRTRSERQKELCKLVDLYHLMSIDFSRKTALLTPFNSLNACKSMRAPGKYHDGLQFQTGYDDVKVIYYSHLSLTK